MVAGKKKKFWDKPIKGTKQFNTYVEEKLLDEFKVQAAKEGKTISKATNEALKNWTHYDNEED